MMLAERYHDPGTEQSGSRDTITKTSYTYRPGTNATCAIGRAVALSKSITVWSSASVHLTGQLSNPTTPVKRLFDAFRRGDFSGGEARGTTRAKHRQFKHLSPGDIDQLVREYCAGLGSVYELADRWGVHRNTVAKHLKSRGLELGRLSLTSDEIRRANELRAQGLSFNAIGRAIGRDPKTVKAALLY